MENYIEKALRTESINGANERLVNVTDELEGLQCDLVRLVEDDADIIKKHIFYGKDIDSKYFNQRQSDIKPTEEQIRLLHAGLGMLTEAQEFLKPILDSILFGTDLDKVNLKEELGDMMWYEAIACDALDTTFEKEQTRNIDKLTARYPEKFTSDKAINRDLDVERATLEEHN